MLISQIIEQMEAFAPLAFQESYDNAGLITGSPEWSCSGATICLDATEQVILEAVKNNCNLVIAHHPIVFSGLKRINGNNYIEKAVITAIKNDIALYAIHTNLDNVLDGVNGQIADKLELINRQVLSPRKMNEGWQNTGSGLIGELAEPISEVEFLTLLKSRFQLEVVKHTSLLGKKIRRVALCGGAGSFLISKAVASGADVFVSGDIKYHEFFDANSRLLIADIGHYESEQFTIDLLCGILREKFPTFAVLKTGVKTNPVHYFL